MKGVESVGGVSTSGYSRLRARKLTASGFYEANPTKT